MDLNKQTAEALGWDKEAKKLAVDMSNLDIKDVTTFVAEMTPIIGDAIAAKEVYDELQKEKPNYYLVGALGGATLIGLIPGIGDVAAKAIKKGAKEIFNVVKRLEVDPTSIGSMGGNISLRSEKPTPKRFNEEALSNAKMQSVGSRDILVEMPIDDFLSAAKTGLDSSKLAVTRSLIKEGKPFDSIPSLSFKNNGDGTGQVTGHEGRHRALALKEKGDNTIPVILTSQAGDGPSIRWGKQTDPSSMDFVDNIPTKLVEEEGSSIIPIPKSILKLMTNKTKVGMAKGGISMALNDETEAVFKSVRGQEIDPVSGNEVPLGSEPEEVRDDIDAKLSEGEYVVPADVVKYYGVKFFEDLRIQAKMGFSQMEANGRIGGEPVAEEGLPFDVSELQMVDDQEPMMNKGGYMSGYADGGSVDSGFEVREYEDENGNIIYIQFMNGVQLTQIPSGYTPKGSSTTTEPVAPTRSSRKNKTPIAVTQDIDWMEAPVEDFEKVVDTLKDPIGNTFTTAFDILTSGTPVGFVKGLGMKSQNKQMLKGIDAQLNNPFISEDQRDRLEAVQAELWDGKLQSGLLSRLGVKSDKQGVGSDFGLGASIYERMGVIDPETGEPYKNTSRTPEEQQGFLTRFFNPKNIAGRQRGKIVDTSDSGAGNIKFTANELAAWEKVSNTLAKRDPKDNTRVNFQGYGGRLYNKNQELDDAQRGEKYKIEGTNVYGYRTTKNKPKIKQVNNTSNNNIDDRNKEKIKSTIVNDSNKPDYSPGAIKTSSIPRTKKGKETFDSKIRRGGGFSKGGLVNKPKKK